MEKLVVESIYLTENISSGANESGSCVSFIAAIRFRQHSVIAFCSSIDFVLNPGL